MKEDAKVWQAKDEQTEKSQVIFCITFVLKVVMLHIMI
jgi:hypothetical protein